MVKVAVIILNYNSHADTAKCISLLQKQKGVTLEIVVVDNASTPDDLTALRSLCESAQCTLIPTSENRGYNAGNNIGLRYAHAQGYDYALVANPDMEFPDEHYVATLLHEMQAQQAVITASDIVTPEGMHQNPLHADGDWRSAWQWVGEWLRPQRPKDTYAFIDNYGHSHPCAKVSGCCFLIRMAFVVEIGFFDEGVFLYCEEAILARQAQQAGGRLYYTTATQAIHRHVKSEKGNPLPRLRHWKRSRHYYIDHYSGDHRLGRWIAKSSVSTYVGLLGWYKRLKR